MKTENYQVLLYYCYTSIENPEDFREQHHIFCAENNLKGRIIIASEGINGTISGLKKDCQLYMEHLKADKRFENIEFKIDNHDGHAFQKLNVRLKDEIVNSGLKFLDPQGKTGKYVEPKDFKQMKNENDVVVLDVRSNYEHQQGSFKNAITLNIDNFREFPAKVDELGQYKDKKIITICTGGVKCEKASAYLKDHGYKEVYQLHGGIIKYGLETDGEDFEGKCYVFDNRLSIPINRKNPTIKNKCYVCKEPNERIVNCANTICNKHVPICLTCAERYEGCCSLDCKNSPDKRVYDGSGYYVTKLNGYNPLKGVKRNYLKNAN